MGGAVYFYHGSSLTVTGSHFELNSADDMGGAIYAHDLTGATIAECTFDQNTGSTGGSLQLGMGPAEVVDCTFTDNHANNGGGFAASHGAANVTIRRSMFEGNSATNDGGGLAMDSLATVSVFNSTFSGNTATVGGGGVYYGGGTFSLENTTVTANTADEGGGIHQAPEMAQQGTLQIRNTIVAANTATSENPDVDTAIYIPIYSLGHNLIGNRGTAWLDLTGAEGDLIGTAGSPIDAMLGPLQDNGGPTLTHAPLVGSPVIDAGDDTGLDATDQRGARRILDGDNDGTWTADIGAVEYFDRFFVTHTADTVDANPGDGIAADASGNTTLRAAIMEANALAGHQTIALGAGTYKLTIPGTGEDGAATGDLDVGDDLTIAGVDAVSTIIDGGGLDRVFEILSARR